MEKFSTYQSANKSLIQELSFLFARKIIDCSFFSNEDLHAFNVHLLPSPSSLNGEFIHYLLLINVLLRMKTVESDKEKLINLLGTTHPDIAMTYENIGIVYEEHKFIYFNKKKEKHKRLV